MARSSQTTDVGPTGPTLPKPPNDNKKPTVVTPSPEFERMRAAWDLPHDLMGGTKHMRARAHKWLPQEEGEGIEAYSSRLHRSFLYNSFRDTVDSLSSKPFNRAIQINDDIDERLKALIHDVDREGTSLSAFARETFREGVKDGVAFILVDFPSVLTDDVGNPVVRTLAEDQRDGIRPYWIQIPGSNMLAIDSEFREGKNVITKVRYIEIVTESSPDNEWEQQEIEQVRVIEVDRTRIYRETREGWKIYQEFGMNNPLNEVPLIAFYTKQVGHMMGMPPLEDLAWMNLAHWQSSSDQRNILKFVRIAILFAAGLSEEDLGKGKVVIGNRMIMASSEQAKLSWVEHTGKGIGAGEADLKQLEEKMSILGVKPLLTSQVGDQTATAKAIDTASSDSSIKQWVRNLENALVQSFNFSAKWLGIDTLSDGNITSVDIDDSFGLSLKDVEHLQSLLQARKDRDISRTTLWKELQRRQVLLDSFDPDAESILLEAEAKDALERSAAFEEAVNPPDVNNPKDKGQELLKR